MASDARKSNKRKCNIALQFRVYPDAAQAELFEKTFACCRFLWNQMLSDEQEFYSATGEHFIPAPARYKKDFPFLKEVDSLALASVHQNLRRAFAKFFENSAHYHYPVYKRKKEVGGSYTTYCQYFKSGPTVYLTDEGIRLPKVGILRATFHRKPLHWWTLKSATIRKTATEKYFCSLLYEYEENIPTAVTPDEDTTLGVTFSAQQLYVDSEGGTGELPPNLKQSQQKLATMQEKLSRMERGSHNYEEQLHKIRLLYERIANQRKDYLHKESRRIANAYDAVCVSDLDLRAVSRQMGNAMEAGFGEFRVQLAYKLERQGKHLIAVKPVPHTTGTKKNRATNAAIHIKHSGLAQHLKKR